MLNPYELLGVTINTSKDDIKKIYYQLALLVHPDKGGNNDDMITLKKAYDYIIKEINNINHTITVEDLEKSFKEFCKTQENTVPLFQDIYAEAFNVEKFNDYFDRHASEETSSSYLKGGYGEMMDKSFSDIKTSKNNQYFEYKKIISDEIAHPTHPFTTTIIECKAPKETQVFQHLVDYTQKEPIDNYSMEIGDLHMSDYKEAFSIKQETQLKKDLQPISTREDNTSNLKTIEELEKERDEIDKMFFESNVNDPKVFANSSRFKLNEALSNKYGIREEVTIDIISNDNTSQNYIWSFQGLIDNTGKVVKDFFKLH